MILYGASGHGKVILDILECLSVPGIRVWDDADKPQLMGYTVTRPLAPEGLREPVIIGIGVNATRKKIADKLGTQVQFGTAIHPAAILSRHIVIGDGTVIMAGAVVNPDTEIGKHCIVNTSASIDHDCRLGDYVHVSPNATLSGDVWVGEGTHIGSGAAIIQGVRIGKWCTIGAGTVVIRDIPDFATVVGNPGRIIKINGVAQ